MFKCHACSSSDARDKVVSEVFLIDDRRVLVEGIPAQVGERCGEATFSGDTAEKVRRLVHGEGHPVRTVPMDVFFDSVIHCSGKHLSSLYSGFSGSPAGRVAGLPHAPPSELPAGDSP